MLVDNEVVESYCNSCVVFSNHLPYALFFVEVRLRDSLVARAGNMLTSVFLRYPIQGVDFGLVVCVMKILRNGCVGGVPTSTIFGSGSRLRVGVVRDRAGGCYIFGGNDKNNKKMGGDMIEASNMHMRARARYTSCTL